MLRRENAPRYRFEKSLFAAFEAVVRRIPDAQIVVTSTWREVVGLTGLRRLFSPDVAEQIVGVTPFALVRDDSQPRPAETSLPSWRSTRLARLAGERPTVRRPRIRMGRTVKRSDRRIYAAVGAVLGFVFATIFVLSALSGAAEDHLRLVLSVAVGAATLLGLIGWFFGGYVVEWLGQLSRRREGVPRALGRERDGQLPPAVDRRRARGGQSRGAFDRRSDSAWYDCVSDASRYTSRYIPLWKPRNQREEGLESSCVAA